VSKNAFSVQNNRVKVSAFMPNRERELSVFRIQDLPEEQIWEIGQRYVSEPQSKTLYARGDVLASVVTENNLTIDPDDHPPRHANVLGWPEDKSAQKLIATELANQATLRVVSPG
jgi:hypothetical protein